MKRWIHASSSTLKGEFSWGKYWYATTSGRKPKFYRADNADFRNKEEIPADEYFEFAEKAATLR